MSYSWLIVIVVLVLLVLGIGVLINRKNAQKLNSKIKLPDDKESPIEVHLPGNESVNESNESSQTNEEPLSETLVVSLEGDGKVYEAQGEVIKIGRHKDNQISLNFVQVSREHVQFTISNGIVSVLPLTTNSATRINGRSIKDSHVIRPGDTLNLGGIDFVVLKARHV